MTKAHVSKCSSQVIISLNVKDKFYNNFKFKFFTTNLLSKGSYSKQNVEEKARFPIKIQLIVGTKLVILVKLFVVCKY